MKAIGLLLILSLIITPGLAITEEVTSLSTVECNFWQEFDITFWQTFPFASIFGYIIDRQLSVLMFPGQAAHWEAIFPFAAAVSALNAFLHTQRRIEHERTGNSHQDHIR